MLRIHHQQQWHELSDPAMEDALIEEPTMLSFTGIDMISCPATMKLAGAQGG